MVRLALRPRLLRFAAEKFPPSLEPLGLDSRMSIEFRRVTDLKIAPSTFSELFLRSFGRWAIFSKGSSVADGMVASLWTRFAESPKSSHHIENDQRYGMSMD